MATTRISEINPRTDPRWPEFLSKMFVVLGLLVFPSDLPTVALPGLALAALLVIVIRPIAVWISTAVQQVHRSRARSRPR